MKRSLLLLALAGTLSLTACGSGDKQDAPRPRNGEFTVGSYADNDNTAAESADAENNDATDMDYKQSEPKLIDTKMLVYSCDMSIDVLDFDKSLDRIHELISSYNGFIESEVYSDGGSSSQWVYSDDEKWKSLSAVIRVPSASYDSFCSDIEDVGDLRRKNASVENLSTEYSDLKTTLAIYEAKEQLSAFGDAYAVGSYPEDPYEHHRERCGVLLHKPLRQRGKEVYRQARGKEDRYIRSETEEHGFRDMELIPRIP